MPTNLFAIVIGVGAVLVGVTFSSITGTWGTSLIPAYIGVVMIALGGLALKPGLKKHAMHAAAAIALLAVLASASGVVKLITGNTVKTAADGTTSYHYGPLSQSITLGLMAIFLVVAINSFIAARRARAVA